MAKKWLSSIGIEIGECDYCKSTQDVRECEICRKDMCCWCEENEYVYDKDGVYHSSICKYCAEENEFVSHNEAQIYEKKDDLIKKLKSGDELDEDDRELIVKMLENI